MRDTLAGLFDDRAARRFAYKPLGAWLAFLAAIAMLLAVTARRVGVPDVLTALSARVRARRAEGARRRAEREVEAARMQSLAIEEQQRLRDAIVARRRREAAPPQPLPPAVPFRPVAPPPGPAPAPTPMPMTPPPGPVASHPAAPAERPLTAAERLALKRRERR